MAVFEGTGEFSPPSPAVSPAVPAGTDLGQGWGRRSPGRTWAQGPPHPPWGWHCLLSLQPTRSRDVPHPSSTHPQQRGLPPWSAATVLRGISNACASPVDQDESTGNSRKKLLNGAGLSGSEVLKRHK